LRLDRSVETATSAILGAVGRLPTVNYSRYLPLEGHDVLQNTALVAIAKFCNMRTQASKLDFGFSLAPPK